MSSVHIDIQQTVQAYLNQQVDPWTIQQTSDIDKDSPTVKTHDVRARH